MNAAIIRTAVLEHGEHVGETLRLDVVTVCRNDAGDTAHIS
jgi:hypothetical protein